MRIGDIQLGYNDGLRELEHNPNVEDYFYNHERLVEKILAPDKWLVLGRKGTGKSLLGGYLVETHRKQNGLAQLCSYKNFKVADLIPLKTSDIAPNQYIQIWRWLMLVELAKLIRDNEQLKGHDDHDRLKTFFAINFGEQAIDTQKIMEVTRTNKLTGSITQSGFGISGAKEEAAKQATAPYTDYVDDLERVVANLIQASHVPYLVVIDELDHRFRKTEIYHDAIIGLIYAADELNRLFRKPRHNAKIVLMLRTDIANWLNDVDLNKIKVDAQVEIAWDSVDDARSPLFDLVLKKAQASTAEWFSGLTRDEAIMRLFPPLDRSRVDRYPLSLTLLRPRDIVTLLNIARDLRPDADAFARPLLRRAEAKYSQYFLDEMKNELKGHIDDGTIGMAFQLLAGIGTRNFAFEDVDAYCRERFDDTSCANLKPLFALLFEFSVVGNGFYDFKRNRAGQRWHYKMADVGIAQIDYTLSIHVHSGLHHVLQLR